MSAAALAATKTEPPHIAASVPVQRPRAVSDSFYFNAQDPLISQDPLNFQDPPWTHKTHLGHKGIAKGPTNKPRRDRP